MSRRRRDFSMAITHTFRQAADAFLTLLYPPHCAACGANLERGQHLCAACAGEAERIEQPFCKTCSQPFYGAIEQEFTCSNCSDRSFHFECAVTRHRSRGIVRDLLIRFKYHGEFYLRHPLGTWLAEGLADPRIAGEKFDCIVPVPLHPTRERDRHFNQARSLAKTLEHSAGAPVFDCLKRVRKTPTQTRFDRKARMENLRNAFQMRNNRSVQGKAVLLVDDVFTTGSTVDECARVLKKSGARSVRVLTVARG
ncbi:MAG TPA: ComF family protein [Chthoniobacteraceae bacterium]|nr:ComF family protein [Chthoniobacteraceae bacterium]